MNDIIIQTVNLGISFGGLKACDNINLTIKKGEIYGLVGPNGAGKTTLFNLLTSIYQPTTGSYYLDNEDITSLTQEQVCKKGIARTFQNIRLFNNMTVIRNVMVGLHNLKEFKCSFFQSVFRLPKHFKVEKAMRDRAKEILDIFGLLEERNNLACNLSYGNQRKLEIARAIATNPKVLLLDEPAAGMNPKETSELAGMIKLIRDKFDLTIIVIEHDLRFVQGICENGTVLNFGTVLAQGKITDILKDKEVIEAYIGKQGE